MYQRVDPVPQNGVSEFTVEPTWLTQHSTLGSSTFSMADPYIPYGEFKCQYLCNEKPGCVAFVGYQMSGAEHNWRFECYFLDAL
ncbi:hypothetical protein CDD83_3859 [Cordyceps sp. RAO-2017]|nr:hypothetical protein CDD83_3859 [Cordyceps sp. RAO-2017]